MKAPEKYGGQLSGLRSISTFPLLSLYCREHYFPSPLPLWLPDRFSHERQYGRLKVGRGEKPRYFSPSLFPGASPPKFQPHPLCFQLLLGSLVLSLAPRDGSSFWVVTNNITFLQCSCSLRGVDGFALCHFWGVSPSHVWFLHSAITLCKSVSVLTLLHLKDPE